MLKSCLKIFLAMALLPSVVMAEGLQYSGKFGTVESGDAACQSIFDLPEFTVSSFVTGPDHHISVSRFESTDRDVLSVFTDMNLVGRLGTSDVFYEKTIQNRNVKHDFKVIGYLEDNAIYLEIELKISDASGQCHTKGEFFGRRN